MGQFQRLGTRPKGEAWPSDLTALGVLVWLLQGDRKLFKLLMSLARDAHAC